MNPMLASGSALKALQIMREQHSSNCVALQHQTTTNASDQPNVNLLHIAASGHSAASQLGKTSMAEYRVYLVDRVGHFYDAVHLTCANDAEAVEQAKNLAFGHGVELWELDRKVVVFPDQNKTQ